MRSLPSIAYIRTSYILSTTTLQRCKLIYAFEGGLGRLRHSPPTRFPSVPELCPFNQRDFTHSSRKNAVYYTPSLPKKQEGVESCRFLDYDNSRTSIP